jgi:hypothetical protein
MKSEQERIVHGRFVKALQHEHLTCAQPGCGGAMVSETITGVEQTSPPWDVASFTMMAELHLLHEQPICPFDDTPITFTSMPNPRRKARYRLSCFFCGRHAEMNWPPPEAKR